MDAKPTVSVIIPVRDRMLELGACIRSLNACVPPPFEIIVVDDASADATADVARSLGATVIEVKVPRDANYCRNAGAEKARGNILLFLDSDVLASASLIESVQRVFGEDGPDAAVGLYAEHHHHPSVSSQYKNLWIRFSYLHSKERIDWIFGAVSAIRKTSFDAAGGFDGTLFMRHGGEDLELGKRMTHNRRRIVLEPSMEVEHLKEYSFSSLMLNDLRRSDGFIRAAKRVGHLAASITRGFVNVYPGFVYSVPLAWLMVAGLLFAFRRNGSWIPLSVAATLYAGINAQFIFYFFKRRGFGQTVQMLGVLVSDHLVCGLGVLRGFIRLLFIKFLKRKD